MKKIIIVTLAAIPLLAIAQKKKAPVKTTVKTETTTAETGVHFIHKVANWNSIVAQAKKENKHIFVDCFTTWCGPCKYVSSKIFPMKNVGDFFNKNFVNVKLQIDETAKDNADVVTSRVVAKDVESKYGINVYPTFLIFDNAGKLVHKFTGAGDDKFMIEKASNGLGSNTQYYTLLDEYKAGKKETNFLKNLLKATADAGDNANEYLKTYIENCDNIFTKENADLLIGNVENTNGEAFKHLYNNKDKWFKIADKEAFDNAITYAVMDEIFGSMKKDETPDWATLTEQFTPKYGSYADMAIVKAQLSLSLSKEDWKNFEIAAKKIVEKYPSAFTTPNELNSLAWAVFENIDDKQLLNAALEWSNKSISKDDPLPAYMDTYANLLYKLGNAKEAIEIEEKAMKMIKDEADKTSFKETLNKMKAGNKTWK